MSQQEDTSEIETTASGCKKAERDSTALDRRRFLAACAASIAAASFTPAAALAEGAPATARPHNLAKVATPSSFSNNSENRISALNDGAEPTSSQDRSNGMYTLQGEDQPDGAHWVQYAWSKPVPVDRIEVYWALDRPRPKAIPGSEGRLIAAPRAYRVLYWNGKQFVPVTGAQGLGTRPDLFNVTTFAEAVTYKLRIEVDPDGEHTAGILEWRVFSKAQTPSLPPVVHAGLDRSVILGGRTYLAGRALWLDEDRGNVARWSKVSGPGSVIFASQGSANTTATFSVPGEYALALTGRGKGGTERSELNVHVEPPPPKDRLDVVYTKHYTINSPLWNARARSLIVDWIPHCIAYCERTDIEPGKGDGGIDNFIEAGKANRGEAHGPHKGYVFSNAWVHQTVESMCLAQMVDAQGDAAMLAAQAHMRDTLERWIPIILAAQMPDGYLQTAYILADRQTWPERWSPEHRGNHEGYVSGYFIESAINHYTLTDGKDLRLYNGAKKLADCWVANIGPGKKEWFDGHQEMEQALVRFGRFVNDQEGHGRGDAYIALARFLLESRRGGAEYDQSHLPPEQQYEAVGHAVRATYFYSGMADIAAETGDRDYQSAVLSLWDNMVNRKYYLTGGIGSGETSEGFGPNYSLRNNAYCESCSSCGLVFFQYKLNLAYHDARFADLYEQTMYNALLGGVDLEGKSFCYTNPLVNTERTRWHVCPCCVGNIPRTLLMMPTWAYAKGDGALYVNLFVGSRVHVGDVAGVPVEMEQETRYPWDGAVAITVRPDTSKVFSIHIRVPDRHTSKLYTETPALGGLQHLAVNGEAVTPHMERGYAVITREWKAGDRIELDIPMAPQRVTADKRVQADLGDVALRYGPLIYNVETADGQNIDQAVSDRPLRAEWRPDLLGGVVAIRGTWKDGSALLAVPHYARMNRVGPAHEYLGDPDINYAPGATTSAGTTNPSLVRNTAAPGLPVVATPSAGAGNTTPVNDKKRNGAEAVQSKVWI